MYTERYGLGIIGWRIIGILAVQTGISAKELAAQTATDAVSITRAVAILVKLNLVHRAVNPYDRRKACLALTPEGYAAVEEISPLRIAIEEELTEILSEEERALLTGIMQRLVERAMVRFGDERDWRTIGKLPRK